MTMSLRVSAGMPVVWATSDSLMCCGSVNGGAALPVRWWLLSISADGGVGVSVRGGSRVCWGAGLRLGGGGRRSRAPTVKG